MKANFRSLQTGLLHSCSKFRACGTFRLSFLINPAGGGTGRAVLRNGFFAVSRYRFNRHRSTCRAVMTMSSSDMEGDSPRFEHGRPSFPADT
jgi:hypothetical protein